MAFLHSLDLFVYPLGQNFKESWGRSTVEAMLTGAIPLVSPGDHLEQLFVHGESGFVCRDFLQYQEYARLLRLDGDIRRKISARCRVHAERELCDASRHRKVWKAVFQ